MNTAQRCWAVSIAVAGMLHFVHPAFGAPLPLQTESGGIAENLSSTNWAGYAAVAPANDHFTYVQAVWTVPTISASSPAFSFSSTWVGLDGFGSSTVEQIGTEADGAPGDSAAAQYYAWIELFPANPLVISNLTIENGKAPDGQGGGMLLFSNNGSALCLTCHRK